MLERTTERLGHMPTFADLLPCPFNLFHRPHSWFDLFTKNGRRRTLPSGRPRSQIWSARPRARKI
jgi:hypothetical protein